jgi:WD40 repeat protein
MMVSRLRIWIPFGAALLMVAALASLGCRPSGSDDPATPPEANPPAIPSGDPEPPPQPPPGEVTPRLPSQTGSGEPRLPSQVEPPPTEPVAKQASWELSRTISADAPVTDVVVSADGRYLFAAAGEDALVIDTTTWEMAHRLPAPAKLTQLAVSPDGKALAAATATLGTKPPLLLWRDWAAKPEPETFLGHEGLITAVAFGPAANPILLSASMDRTLRIWDLASGQSRAMPHERESATEIAIAPDGRTMATGSASGLVFLWNLTAQGQPRRITGHSDLVNTIAFSPDGRLLATAAYDDTQIQFPGTIVLWQVSNGARLANLFGHLRVITSLDFSPDGRWLASGSGDNGVRLWRMKENGADAEAALTGHEGYVNAVAFGRDSQYLASASDDKTIRIWTPVQKP